MTIAADEASLEGINRAPAKEARSAAQRLAARYLFFGTLAVVFVGFMPSRSFGGISLLVTAIGAWFALSMATLAWAFSSRDPSLLGKQQDGSLAWPSAVVLLPYLVGISLFARLKRWFLASARSVDEVAPGVFLAPLPLPADVPEGVGLVVDLTAEFREHRGVIEGRRYLCLPTLNRVIPRDDDLVALLEELVKSPDAMLIHCGAGKGRSAEVAAALLIRRGLAASVDEAEAQLRKARPCVQLHTVQREQLSRLFAPSAGTVAP